MRVALVKLSSLVLAGATFNALTAVGQIKGALFRGLRIIRPFAGNGERDK